MHSGLDHVRDCPSVPADMSSERSDDFSLLGHESKLPASPEEAKLETFTNKSPGRPYTIDLDCPEFSSLCPVTGQPDTALISIRYVPDKLCIESKSLKFYLASYRNCAAFNEAVANRIADDITSAVAPRGLELRAEFAARGGISLSVEGSHP